MNKKIFKSYSLDDINAAVLKVERSMRDETAENNYVEFDKLRFINKNALFNYVVDLFSFNETKLDKYISLNLRKVFKLFYGYFFKNIRFNSSSDILHIRNNLSLFYLKDDFRVKVFMGNDVRSISDFKNEYNVRKKINESNVCLNVPAIIGELSDGEVTYFKDKIIFGKMYGWSDATGTKVLRKATKEMWQFYQYNGIRWGSLTSNGIDVDALNDQCKKSISNNNRDNYKDIERILTFRDKKIPSSLIHGDLSLGNIIVSNNENYIIDWELSHPGIIIKDLYKILDSKPELFADIDQLMTEEIETSFTGKDKNYALTLREQLLLERCIRSLSTRS